MCQVISEGHECKKQDLTHDLEVYLELHSFHRSAETDTVPFYIQKL